MAHTGEKACFTAEVYVVYDNKVLLRRHRKFNSMWLSVGGHVEDGEDPAQTAIREVKEEVGLDVELYSDYQLFHTNDGRYQNVVPPVAVGRHPISESPDHIVFNYFARAHTDALELEKPTDECRWYSKEELASLELEPNIREYAEAALKALASA